jgi:ribonuclease III family protein
VEEAKQIKQKNATELAFMGDAVFEALVREHITRTVDTNANTLHRMAVEYVCAEAQSAALSELVPLLNEDELGVIRRGKNASKVTAPRNVAPKTYRTATALEALFGYLYLLGERERIRELFSVVIAAHESQQDK